MNDIVSELKKGSDLWVVLKNRYGEAYTESYHLSNILLVGDKFWGKFKNVHTAEFHSDIDKKQVVSYAYNNFSDIVCTSCLNECLERYYSSQAYSSIRFVTKNKYRKIWSSDRGWLIDYSISSAVKECRRIKISITSNDGYQYILPAHTVECCESSGEFSIESEFDGYPDRLRYLQAIESMDLSSSEEDLKHYEGGYLATPFRTCNFFYTSFVLTKGRALLQRYIAKNSVRKSRFSFEKIDVFCES